MDRFGEKLRTLRKQRGLTVRELAVIFEMKSHSHIADMENGRSKPSVELLVKIADFFEVTTDQLLRDELEID
jgi:transcriptional regulator with XRE-family HTH domain